MLKMFSLREKFIIFFRYYSILLSEAKYKARYGRGLKIITHEKMFQSLPIALAQVQAGSTFENLFNEIRQIIYSMYCAKEITKKVYNNIMNSVKF